MIDAIGGRKVLVTLIAYVTGIVCICIKADVPPNFLTLLLGLTGFYIAGNVFEAKTSGSANKPVDLTDVHTKLDGQADALATTQQGVAALVNYVNGANQKQQ